MDDHNPSLNHRPVRGGVVRTALTRGHACRLAHATRRALAARPAVAARIAPIVAIVACSSISLMAREARGDDESTINLGINSYNTGRYPECIERFRDMLSPSSSKLLQDTANKPRARMYLATCLIAVGSDTDAESQMRTLILDNPRFRPDPAIFPKDVVDRFTEVQGRLKPEIEALEKRRLEAEELERQARDRERRAASERIEKLRSLATQEEIIRRNSRWYATIPFGVGQFQNEQPVLGWMFLGTEVAAGVTSIVSSIIQQSIVSRYEPGVTDPSSANKNASRAELVNRISFGILIGVGIGGVAQAHWSFVPEVRETRYRPLPADLSWTIAPMAVPGGGSLSVGRRF